MKLSSRLLHVYNANRPELLQQCWTISLRVAGVALDGRRCWVLKRMDIRRMVVRVDAVLCEERRLASDIDEGARKASEIKFPPGPFGSMTKLSETADMIHVLKSADNRPGLSSKNMAICEKGMTESISHITSCKTQDQ